MSNAETAIRAAKDLNADSLVPELYRGSVDAYQKAKREYRLKNFENARKLSRKATRLAEQAEFEAYRMGGATPEVASQLTPTEGASPDAEASFRASQKTPSNEPSLPPEKPEEPELPPQDFSAEPLESTTTKEEAPAAAPEPTPAPPSSDTEVPKLEPKAPVPVEPPQGRLGPAALAERKLLVQWSQPQTGNFPIDTGPQVEDSPTGAPAHKQYDENDLRELDELDIVAPQREDESPQIERLDSKLKPLGADDRGNARGIPSLGEKRVEGKLTEPGKATGKSLAPLRGKSLHDEKALDEDTAAKVLKDKGEK